MTRRRQTVRQLLSFATIGALSTAAYAVLFAVLRGHLNAAEANALALLVTAVANTAANRRYTFGVRSSRHRARDHAAGLVGFGTALAITSAGLAALNAASPHAGRATETALLVAANAVATVVRFVVLRGVMGMDSAGTTSRSRG